MKLVFVNLQFNDWWRATQVSRGLSSVQVPNLCHSMVTLSKYICGDIFLSPFSFSPSELLHVIHPNIIYQSDHDPVGTILILILILILIANTFTHSSLIYRKVPIATWDWVTTLIAGTKDFSVPRDCFLGGVAVTPEVNLKLLEGGLQSYRCHDARAVHGEDNWVKSDDWCLNRGGK